MAMNKYRVYASRDSSFRSIQYVNGLAEIQVALAFARDYDREGNHTNGKFTAYFNGVLVTPELITQLKAYNNQFRFFLSIGGRSSKYPFAIQGQANTWVDNAYSTLKDIINKYHLDGIDVYYEHLANDEAGRQFVYAIGTVIQKLRDTQVISLTSISVSGSGDAINGLYRQLYNGRAAIIETVVYQTHSERNRVDAVDDLVGILGGVGGAYPEGKLLAGHSIRAKDWITVQLPIFLGAIPSILKGVASGISEWTITTDDPENIDD